MHKVAKAAAGEAATGMTPRLLTKAEAAAYCGCTVRAFTGWVDRRIVPTAIRGTHRWDRKALDAALDQASNLTITPSDQLTPYQRWKADEAQGNWVTVEAETD